MDVVSCFVPLVLVVLVIISVFVGAVLKTWIRRVGFLKRPGFRRFSVLFGIGAGVGVFLTMQSEVHSIPCHHKAEVTGSRYLACNCSTPYAAE